MNQHVIVIGGGTAGMEAAGRLARAGLLVTLIEKGKDLGGHIRNWYHLFPDRRSSDEVFEYLKGLISHQNIRLLTEHTVTGFIRNGNEFTVNTGTGETITGDAVLMATGFDLFKSERKEEYGYGIYDNVISSADLEAMFRNKEVKLTSGKNPERIGFIHCVGSRDEKAGNIYCSKLCCVTAVKQAIEIKKIFPACRVFSFYMDMRMGGALYEELYKEAQEKYSVGFIRGKVSEVAVNINNRLVAKVEDTLVGRPLKMELDMLVLMAGMEMAEDGIRIADGANLQRGENRFFQPADHHFGTNTGNVNGVFYAGACTAPLNITETISHARSAVTEIVNYLNAEKK